MEHSPNKLSMQKALKIQLFLKRCMDLAIVFIFGIGLLPLWLLIALWIKLDSKGPVLFIHQRPGFKARPFGVFKFRTMREGSESMIKGKEVSLKDSRITKFGRFLRRTKLDEMPQLINVLLGQMSVVGPRPERTEYLTEYTAEEMLRFEMKPGMTGLAQVNGNICISLQERHAYDLSYVRNFNLCLDIKIIAKTVLVVFWGEKIFAKRNSKA